MTLQAAGQNAEYDEHTKYLLSYRIVLPHILVHVIWEFKGMNPENVVQLIEGEPEAASVPANPGVNLGKELAGEAAYGIGFDGEAVLHTASYTA